MADILCPICNRVNDSGAERCWYCQARLPKDQTAGSEQNDSPSGTENQDAFKDSQKKPAASPGGEDVPDWLAHIRELEQEEHQNQDEVKPFSDEKKDAEENPDWLSSLRQDADADKSGSSEEQTTSDEQVIQNIGAEDQQENPSTVQKEEGADAFESFLVELGIGTGKAKEQPVQPSVEEPKNPPVSAVPHVIKPLTENVGIEEPLGVSENHDELNGFEKSWFEDRKDSAISSETQPEEHAIPQKEPQPETPPQSHEEGSAAPFPWESHEKLEEPAVPEPEAEKLEAEESIEERLPVLPTLSDKFGSIPPADNNADILSFDNDDLPEWLTFDQPLPEKKPEKPVTPIPEPAQTVSQEPAIEKSATEKTSAGKIERAQLPAWLHAIRPVESMAPIEPVEPAQPQEEKGEGILAGIDGVLHSPNLASQMTKPHVYSSGIEVNERQQKNADLFKSLLEETTAESLFAATTKLKSKGGTMLRVVITLLLLAAVILPFFYYAPLSVTPALYPAEVVNTLSEIQNLPSAKPVLIAAHFEAGLAGELTWTSRVIIDHLLMRNIPMAVISTNSIGSAVLDEEIRDVAQGQPGYLLDDQLVNFGYLPGGTLGILSLSEDLRQTIQYTADLQPAWQKPVFQNIYQLSDFGAVIVITDNADIVKSWVEQAGISPTSPPLLAIVSAQASPMTQPYYDSGQIKGYVAGMNGSLAYEQILQRPSSVTTEYSSLQITLIVIALIIFLGGAVTLILPSASGFNKEGGD
jgi:hypothetical protein